MIGSQVFRVVGTVRTHDRVGCSHLRVTLATHMPTATGAPSQTTTIPYHTISYHTIPYHTISYHIMLVYQGKQPPCFLMRGGRCCYGAMVERVDLRCLPVTNCSTCLSCKVVHSLSLTKIITIIIIIFYTAGACQRCQMICVDQSTGEHTSEPLLSLAKFRRLQVGYTLLHIHIPNQFLVVVGYTLLHEHTRRVFFGGVPCRSALI